MAIATGFLSPHSLSPSSLALRISKFSSPGLALSRSPRVEIAKPFPFLHGSIASSSSGFLGRIRGSDSQSSIDTEDTLGSSSSMSDQDTDVVPMPIVLIDQDSDSDATIVQLSFGDRLGALVDTMKALRDLGLDVAKGTVTTEASVIQTKFYIMRSGRKVEDPAMLEKIRLTIINNLLMYHPESSEKLAMGEVFGIKPPEKKKHFDEPNDYPLFQSLVDVDIATHIFVQDDGPKRSLLYIETADRPGLLLEIIKIIVDINIDVESAEIDTEGLVAKDKFHVSYGGAALNSSLSQVLTNSLRYYLRRPETDEGSY
ncbi:ACT domain-containing protein ACR12-like isoform X1 [Phoenix dactylifera]|uniref:ACT domain-containing protein ACR n=1 Tax=Phoenix dactylifera TaxID=42345 RepID=A0A8B7BRP8_PHODC|nr:ACT domain-containing protein ACR12-like isoform X1 [Phoenix dactylifera]